MSRRRTSPEPLLEDEDLLQEILLRLPPKPSSLPRASLVCTRWHKILSDHQFLEHFRKHHRKPPLLGFFEGGVGATPIFTSVMDPPDHIPVGRFSVPQSHHPLDNWRFDECRHGLVVLLEVSRREIVVWDPLTGQQHDVTFPPGIGVGKRYSTYITAVLCADAADGHVHGDCFLSPFKLVLIWSVGFTQTYACLYESASGAWEDIFSLPTTETDTRCYIKPSVLAGNALFWLLGGGGILVFDFVKKSLCVIEKPADPHITMYRSAQLLRTEGGGLGLAVLWELTIKLWERKSNSDGVARWLLTQKTALLDLFPRTMRTNYSYRSVLIVGYDEESNDVILSMKIGNFMLHLDSMKITHIIKREDTICYNTFLPYRSFYTAGS